MSTATTKRGLERFYSEKADGLKRRNFTPSPRKRVTGALKGFAATKPLHFEAVFDRVGNSGGQGGARPPWPRDSIAFLRTSR